MDSLIIKARDEIMADIDNEIMDMFNVSNDMYYFTNKK